MDYSALPLTLEEVRRLHRVNFHNRGQLPSETGVYFVLYGTTDSRIAYLGKAKNIQKRWIGHHRIPELILLSKLAIPAEIAWIAVPEADLAEAEQLLISTFAPPLNDGLTLEVARARVLPSTNSSRTVEGIIEEFRARRDNAVDLLVTEEFWNLCNDDDGDLLCVWPFVDDAVLVELDMLWTYRDNHDTLPSRIIRPPLFSANTAPIVQPNRDYEASWAERLAWTLRVARQVDSFLLSIVHSHAANHGDKERHRLMGLITSEPNVERTIREHPEAFELGS